MSLRTGIDVASVDRVESVIRRFGNKFRERFFAEVETDAELPPRTYAGFWAVKEAAFKAIGRGYRWKGVRVDQEPSGRPFLEVDYEEARLGETPIPPEADWDCSISHDGGIAVAFAACYW